jgi:sulfoxide reductase heme-binding subunit YedZ
VLVAVAIHGLSLIGDKYLHPSLAGVTIPFALDYQQFSTSLGIVAGWGLIILGLSYYLRRHIGASRWRMIHRFTVLAWAAALIHSFAEGTDSGQTWFIALIGITALPAVVALVARVAGRPSGQRTHSAKEQRNVGTRLPTTSTRAGRQPAVGQSAWP